jgi:hypothetical protein
LGYLAFGVVSLDCIGWVDPFLAVGLLHVKPPVLRK